MPAYVDSHTHLYLRGAEDLQAMAREGVRAAVLCAYVPVRPSGSATLLDLFRWLLENEPPRFAACGLQSVAAVGVHPRCIPETGLDRVLEEVDRLLASRAAAALGEVGLDTAGAQEKDVFAAQLQIARRHQAPVVVHTPRADKERVLGEALGLLESSGVDPARVVVDHLSAGLVARVRERGFQAGLTVQLGKLSLDEVVAVVRAHGPEGLLVDSDAALDPADPLAVPKVARRMKEAGLEDAVERVTSANAAAFFALERIGC